MAKKAKETKAKKSTAATKATTTKKTTKKETVVKSAAAPTESLVKLEKPMKAPKASKTSKKDKKSLELESKSLETINQEDAEEAEDEMLETAAKRSSARGPQLNETEDDSSTPGASGVGVTMRNFRQHPDIENFYRFIIENDLRPEAFTVLNAKFESGELKATGAMAKMMKSKSTH